MRGLPGAAVIIFTLSMIVVQVRCGEKKAMQQYASLDPSVTYVGMETCKGCHADIYNTYVKTGMGLSIDKASRHKSSADFSNHPAVYDKYTDLWYHPQWINDSLYFTEFRLKDSDTLHKRMEKIEYIIGSGQHTNSHIYSANGYLYQAPLTYYTQKKTWDLPPGFENGNNTRFNRIIGLECISCHNAYPEIAAGSENKFISVPNGIDCERCHGPGSRHVEEKKAGRLVDISKEIDYSIVNPSKLPVDLQLDVCQRCHIQGNAVLKEGKSFLDFRPGMKLSDVMDVYMPVYSGSESEHIMASHAERLKESACYINTTMNVREESGLRPYSHSLTCITCHDPHVSRLETKLEKFNNACKNCHGDAHNGCTAEPAMLKAENFNCVKCHMPENSTTDIPHVSVHDHKIRIPVTEKEKESIRIFAGIKAINNPDPGEKSKARAYINYFEKFEFGPEVLDSAEALLPFTTLDERKENIADKVHISFLRRDYATLIKDANSVQGLMKMLGRPSLQNSDAWTSYRIAEAFKQTGNTLLAEQWMRNCCRLAPLDPVFNNEFAEILIINKKMNEAESVLKNIISFQPKFAAAYNNLGYARMLSGDLAEAGRNYDAAIALEPDYESALMNKAAWMLMKRDEAGALILLKRVLDRNPHNKKAVAALKQLGAQ